MSISIYLFLSVNVCAEYVRAGTLLRKTLTINLIVTFDGAVGTDNGLPDEDAER